LHGPLLGSEAPLMPHMSQQSAAAFVGSTWPHRPVLTHTTYPTPVFTYPGQPMHEVTCTPRMMTPLGMICANAEVGRTAVAPPMYVASAPQGVPYAMYGLHNQHSVPWLNGTSKQFSHSVGNDHDQGEAQPRQQRSAAPGKSDRDVQRVMVTDPDTGSPILIKPILCKQTEEQRQKLAKGKRVYNCPYCGHIFSCSSNLIRHKRVHTGDKPYKCSHCDARFASCSNRKTHERKCKYRQSRADGMSSNTASSSKSTSPAQ